MGKSRKANYRKGTTWLGTKRYKVDGYGKQTIINIFGCYLIVGSNDYDKYIKIGDTKYGLVSTTRPPFSVRENKRKFIKVGKYYIYKTW